MCADPSRRAARVYATRGGWTDIHDNNAGCEATCTWTDQVHEADAIVWFPSGGHALPSSLAPTQTLAIWNREPREFADLAWSDREPRVDLAITYNLDANVPMNYVPAGFVERAYAHPIPSEADFAQRGTAVWLSSNCNQFSYDRLEVVRRLQKHIQVDCLGSCLANGPKWPGRPWEVIPKYKFWLGLEKSVDQEYVTEKFLFPLMYNGVPVYIGSSRASEYAPSPGAYVDGLAFGSIDALGEHLRAVAANYTAWRQHFAWRDAPVPQRLRDLANLGEGGAPVCRLCACLCDPTCNSGRNAGHGSQPSRYNADTVRAALII